MNYRIWIPVSIVSVGFAVGLFMLASFPNVELNVPATRHEDLERSNPKPTSNDKQAPLHVKPAIEASNQHSVGIEVSEFAPQAADRIAETLSSRQYLDDISRMTSKMPLGDGRNEIIDENGEVIARDERSPQENEELGYNELNRYRNSDLAHEEFQKLSHEGDPAADIALARNAYRQGDFKKLDEYVIKSFRDSGHPAAMGIAGDLYRSPIADQTGLIISGAWYSAAYVFGDFSVAYKIDMVLNSLPPSLHEQVFIEAAEILKQIGD